jgi:hypothetical protein
VETVIRDGQLCDGILESSTLSELGMQSGDTLTATIGSKKEREKRKPPVDEKAANKAVKKLLGNRSSLLPRPFDGRESNDADTLAVQFMNMESAGAGLDGLATDMWIAQRAAQRITATERAADLVAVEVTGNALQITYRAKKGAAVIEESVVLLPKPVLIDVFVGILSRQGGSSRRRYIIDHRLEPHPDRDR